MVMVLVLFLGCKKSTVEYIGNWIKRSDFEGIPRGSAVSFVLGDKVYFGTGFNSGQDIEYLKDFWMYDMSRDFWTKLTDFPGEPRIGAVAFTINGKNNASPDKLTRVLEIALGSRKRLPKANGRDLFYWCG